MKIAIGGDISCKGAEKLFAQQNTKELFNDVKDVMRSADEVIVNLECAVTDKCTPIKKYGPNIKAPFGTVEVLKETGVTICALSNNHVFDFGKAGIKDTLAELKKNNIAFTGFGNNEEEARENYYIKRDNKIIAIVNVCEHEYSYALPNRMGARAYDPYDTNDDILEAKKHADFVIVIYHGGKEGVSYPSPRLRKLCKSMIKHGADVVLCQHSHCIGCEEYFNGGYILYGQGNFHFVFATEMDLDDKWNNGLLIQLNIENDKFTVERLPVEIKGFGIELSKGKRKEQILNGLMERSKTLQTDEWQKKWCEEVLELQSSYSFIPEVLNEKFGHYLDCEAHTDALKELYKTWNSTNEI